MQSREEQGMRHAPSPSIRGSREPGSFRGAGEPARDAADRRADPRRAGGDRYRADTRESPACPPFSGTAPCWAASVFGVVPVT